MKDENLVCFMDVYKCVLDYFALDEDKYNIYVLYENNIFSLDIYNETKKINAFHKSMILCLEKSTELKNLIRNDFIDNISLPCIYNHYNKMTHVIKNYKFILNIDILENELDEMNISQRKALLKMLK